MKTRLNEELQVYLAPLVGTTTYGELAVIFDTHPRAVGSAMRALGRKGFWSLCEKVLHQNSHMHNAPVHQPEQLQLAAA